MIVYPLTAWEERLIRVAERIVVIAAAGVILVMGAVSFAST